MYRTYPSQKNTIISMVGNVTGLVGNTKQESDYESFVNGKIANKRRRISKIEDRLKCIKIKKPLSPSKG